MTGTTIRLGISSNFLRRIFFCTFFVLFFVHRRNVLYNASIAIQVLPQVATGDEVIRIVDTVIAYLKSTGLNTFVGPFETTVEGDYDQLWEIAGECQRICIREGAGSVSAYIKVVYNPQEGVWSIDKKTTKHHVSP
jgi:uncharacterized protein YqgV (UPF0045/DUF77 family)